MQLGVAIAILICIVIILLILFYLVTRYFNHRLQKSLQNQNQVYSMVEGIQANRADFMDGEYSDFAESRIREWKRLEEQRKKTYLDIAGTGALRQSLFQSDFKAHEKSPLQIRLERQPIPLGPQSVRSTASLRSIGVEKLESFRSNNSMKSNQTGHQNNYSLSKSHNITKHKFINKLVAYTIEGISIVENTVTDIWKRKDSNQIRERKKVTKNYIGKNDQHFYSLMQVYGFEPGVYGAYKYTLIVEIAHMRSEIIYPVKQLRQIQSKQQISLTQYNHLVAQIQQQM